MAPTLEPKIINTYKTQGIFRCAPHKFTTDEVKPIPEQEDEWYQHLRDEAHGVRYSKPCQNCGNKCTDKTKGKVPQPTADVKNPKSIIVFCNDKCRNQYLKKLGVSS